VPGLRAGTAALALASLVWAGARPYPAAGFQLPASDARPRSSAAFTFTNIAREAGLDMSIVLGGRETNTYLVETTGTGVAMFDYDGDGWIDLFFVNGSTLEGFAPGSEPTSRLYRNRGNRTFEDVTAQSGLAVTGWGQGACVGVESALP
jgi:hypothetical protein